MAFEFSEENRPKLENLIKCYPVKEAAMLPTLHLAQQQNGYITEEVMDCVAEVLEVFLDPRGIHPKPLHLLAVLGVGKI